MPTMLTRIKIADFEEWKAMFDSDPPRAREHATGWRVLRGWTPARYERWVADTSCEQLLA